ncbi:MAG: hypothetical protein KBD57_11640 [Bacteroidia bacterium]|nr:hypothetical protein [Bacteroidia bacterium]
MKKILLLLSVAGLITSCANDNLEELHPEVPQCDTTGVLSFATDITPIMNLHCGTDDVGCHINPLADGGCGLANYADMMDYLVSPAKDTKFIKTVTHDPTLSTSLYMPQGTTEKIDDCSIQKSQAWIGRGKPNN